MKFIIGVVLGVVLGIILSRLPLPSLGDKIEKITMKPVGGAKPWGNKELITIRYKSGREEQYRGESSVWHSYPDGKRQGTMTESWLCDIWQREKWKREKA